MRTPVAFQFNAPPRAGKDTALLAILEAFPDAPIRVFKFTEPIKQLTHERLGLNVPFDFYDPWKDTRLDDFDGLTPREAYIKTSTEMKERYGEDVFVRMVMDSVREAEEDILIFPDVGDDLEGQAVVDTLGEAACRLLRIHKDGHNFDNCCREYFMLEGVETYEIINITGREDRYKQQVVDWARPAIESALGKDLSRERGVAAFPGAPADMGAASLRI